jgi:hypothetical protein
MSQYGTIRVYNETETFGSKKDPSARYAKQTRAVLKDGGRASEFQQFLNLDRESPLPAGDYDVVPGHVVVTRKGEIYMPFELVLVKAAAKVA